MSLFLFSVMMDVFIEQIRRQSWNMMYVDNMVICTECLKDGQAGLAQEREVLEGREMKSSQSKMEHAHCNFSEVPAVGNVTIDEKHV